MLKKTPAAVGRRVVNFYKNCLNKITKSNNPAISNAIALLYFKSYPGIKHPAKCWPPHH